MKNQKREQRIRRKRRVRSRVRGTATRPRLSIFRSNRHIFAQLIDDTAAHTIVSVSDKDLPKIKKGKRSRVVLAEKAGALIAKKAMEKKIEMVVFDRGRYRYHGIVKSFAQGARKEGLKF